MKYYNITWALALIMLASGCKTDTIEVDPPAEPGTEVNFSAALAPSTRTIYGDETSTGIAVNWVKGDAVRISSPQCQNSSSVVYDVNIGNAESLNYAESLDKQGSEGLRWGNETTGYDFYSIYPANENTSLNGATANLNISSTQYCGITTLPAGEGQTLNLRPYMANAVMYAATRNVSSEAKTVNLRYEPYATVLDVTLNGPNPNVADVADQVTIQRITLTAPNNTTISGDFTFDLSNANTQGTAPAAPTVTAGDGSNSITLIPLIWEDPSKPDNGRLLSLDKTNYTSARVKFFIIPQEGMTVGNGWSITVQTTGGSFTKNLDGVTDGLLKPGAIHKMTLPHLDMTKEWTYTANNWITSLPDYKNIYLSELTLPGAWYGIASEYQGSGLTYQSLINSGVRAIGLETRCYTPRKGTLGGGDLTNDEPTKVVISGGGSNKNGAYTHQWAQENLITDLSTALEDIAQYVPADEFVVVVLSYADGGSGGHRALDYNYWLQGIYDAYNSMTQYKDKIYTNQITPGTTVADVAGKLIIKVNVGGNLPGGNIGIGNYVGDNQLLPGLLSYTDMSWDTSTGIDNASLISEMYWKNWSSDYMKNLGSGITGLDANQLYFNYTLANRTQESTTANGTGGLPSQYNRRNSILTIVNNSESIYKAGSHNVWFFVGAGGVQAESQTSTTSATDFAQSMNAWILQVLQAKLNGTALPNADGTAGTGTNLKPSPLGMVMCNYITGDNATYHGPDIIDAIIRINSVIELEHKPTSTEQLNIRRYSSHMKRSPNWIAF